MNLRNKIREVTPNQGHECVGVVAFQNIPNKIWRVQTKPRVQEGWVESGGLAVVREIYLLRIKGCGPAGCPVWERLKWTAPYNEIIAMEIQRI